MTTICVRRQGQGHAIKIPKQIAEELNINPGSKLEATVVDGSIVLTPLVDKPSTLLNLLNASTKEKVNSKRKKPHTS